MPASPEITFMRESLRHVKEGIDGASDILRHEGLKRGAELAITAASGNQLGRWILEHAAGQYTFDTALKTEIGGLELNGPTGLAAGWDKTGQSVLGWQFLGANHTTVGGVTFFKQSGNRMVRLRTFDERIGDHGTSRSLNSFGFYSPGSVPVVHNIRKQKDSGELEIPVIVQVTLNKEYYEEENKHMIPRMIAATIQKVLPVAKGISLGISSPNTAGMRDSQKDWEFIYSAVSAARDVMPQGMYFEYKGDADGGTERFDMYCRLAEMGLINVIGLINTTVLPHIKGRYRAAHLPGGLAGGDQEYLDMAIDAVRYVYENVGDKIDIMGLGGVGITLNNDRTSMGDQGIRLLRAGASALGVNTGVRFNGTQALRGVDRSISEYLKTQPTGQQTVSQIIGIDTKRGVK